MCIDWEKVQKNGCSVIEEGQAGQGRSGAGRIEQFISLIWNGRRVRIVASVADECLFSRMGSAGSLLTMLEHRIHDDMVTEH